MHRGWKGILASGQDDKKECFFFIRSAASLERILYFSTDKHTTVTISQSNNPAR